MNSEPTSTPVLAAYWRSQEPVVNLGDYATQILLEWFGYQVVAHGAPEASRFEVCHLFCGTLLGKSWFSRLKPWHLNVWGSGASGPLEDHGDDKRIQYHAVRGPRSARHVGDSRLPQGDPALLFPYFITFDQASPCPRSIYVPHFLTPALPHSLPQGFNTLVAPSCHRSQWRHPLEQIATAAFVGSSSLHGCIFAHAYGVPWAPCLRPGDGLNMPEKWKDWFEYLDIDSEAHLPSSLPQAETWWTQIGQYAQRPSLRPLVNALPLPVLQPQAREVLAQIP